MRPGRNIAICALVVLFLSGCVFGIPDANPLPPPPRSCQVWVKIDNRPWHCYERGEVLNELCKATACSP